MPISQTNHLAFAPNPPTRPNDRQRNSAVAGKAGLLVLVIFAAGCHSKSDPTPKNFTAGIAKYLVDHPDCLYKTAIRFPYETSDKAEMQKLDSLVTAKQLDRQVEQSIHVARYTATTIGAKAVPRFCYGYRHITGIDSFTPPAKAADGFNESKVTYTYGVEDVPIWAKTPQVLAAFPEMAQAIQGPDKATLTLAQTGVGWQVPD